MVLRALGFDEVGLFGAKTCSRLGMSLALKSISLSMAEDSCDGVSVVVVPRAELKIRRDSKHAAANTCHLILLQCFDCIFVINLGCSLFLN